jgi:hypothetical protein
MEMILAMMLSLWGLALLAIVICLLIGVGIFTANSRKFGEMS